MAIYHLSGSVISRSQGRSAVACAAYRAAEKLQDEKYAKTHDYTRKQDVLHSEILLPKNSPDWMKDREKLWNTVEAVEKRKDAQLAREVQFSLPRELSNEQNMALAREFIQHNFVDKGMVADWAFHVDKTASGELQPHVHVMLTLREVTPEGFGQKVREWNHKEFLLQWRENWAETANRHLTLNGHDIQIDHRSHAERGIDLEPQHKIGAAVASERMARLADHQRIARENGEKILANPKIALDALTQQQSTFTHQDLARFINRHTADAEQFQQVYENVKGSPHIVLLGKDEQDRDRFTTQDMFALEAGMMANAQQLKERENIEVKGTTVIDVLLPRTLSEQQKSALVHLSDSGDLKCVVGYAGSGKSYLLGAAREAWEKEGYRVIGAALSGIAAETLEGSSGIESRTLASRFYYWDKGEQLLTSKDVLVIDEAGMIGSRQMARLMDEAQKHGSKIVLVGDPEQLQAIDAGAAFRAIAEKSGFAELSEIRRQSHDWQRTATRQFAQGKTGEALKLYQRHDHVHEFETQAMAKKSMVEQWNDVRISEPSKTQIMLAYTRQDVQDLNAMAREMRHALNELGKDHILQTARGERQFAEHDRVYFMQNDRDMGVKNGTLGTILSIEDKRLTIQLDKGDEKAEKIAKTVTVDIEKYNHLDHGYAATIHKSQGVTVDRSYLLASRYMDRHAAYVGMSRHRDSADLFYSREEFKHERGLVQNLSRESGKDTTLDYKSFAENRGIEKDTQATEQALIATTRLAEKTETEKGATLDKNARYEQLLQEGARNYERLQDKTQRPDFREFKAQFEAQYAEHAKALQDILRPRHERLALEAENKIKVLEKAIEQSRMPRTARQELSQYAGSVAKQPEVMNYLKQHNPELSQKIQGLAKSQEIERSRGGRSL